MKKYYDPEYERIVTEDVVRRQYEWFSNQKWFNKTFEQFAQENFTLIERGKMAFYKKIVRDAASKHKELV